MVRFQVGVSINGRQWSVEHRYNEFDELHTKLKKHSPELKVKLPPKKFRPSGDYLEKRRIELGTYLNELLDFYELKIPLCLSQFLFFFKFQVSFILEEVYCVLGFIFFFKLKTVRKKIKKVNPYNRLVKFLRIFLRKYIGGFFRFNFYTTILFLLKFSVDLFCHYFRRYFFGKVFVFFTFILQF